MRSSTLRARRDPAPGAPKPGVTSRPNSEPGLSTARTAYETVVIDAGSDLDERSLAVLERAEAVVIPIVPEIGALKALHSLLDYLTEVGSAAAAATFVLNHQFAREMLSMKQIEAAIGRRSRRRSRTIPGSTSGDQRGRPDRPQRPDSPPPGRSRGSPPSRPADRGRCDDARRAARSPRAFRRAADALPGTPARGPGHPFPFDERSGRASHRDVPSHAHWTGGRGVSTGTPRARPVADPGARRRRARGCTAWRVHPSAAAVAAAPVDGGDTIRIIDGRHTAVIRTAAAARGAHAHACIPCPSRLGARIRTVVLAGCGAHGLVHLPVRVAGNDLDRDARPGVGHGNG